MAESVPHGGGNSLGDEDSIEPVYFKLENFQSESIPNSDPDQDAYYNSDEDSSVGEEDIELDLFAPPHDS